MSPVERIETLKPTHNELHDPFFDRLPFELVSAIFQQCLPFPPSLDVFNPNFDSKKHIEAVYTLGHVCQNWRRIAQHSPTLWTILAMNIVKSNCVPSVQTIDEWIRRSGGSDLFVQLDAHKVVPDPEDPSPSPSVDAVEIVIALIAPHAQRCRVLDVGCHSQLAPLFSSALSRKTFHHLEHLKATIDDSEEAISFKLNASPRLLTMQDGYFGQISVDFSQLNHFFFSSKGQVLLLRECMYLFQIAPRLSFCRLSNVSATHPPDPMPKLPVTHLSLQTLQVEVQEPRFWDYFAFPALTTLRITDSTDDQTWVHVKDFLRRSGCPITDLVLHDERGNHPSDIIDILRLTPDLERLSIEGHVLKGSLFSAMGIAATKDTGTIFAKLRSLTLSYPRSPLRFDWASLVILLTTLTARSDQTLQFVEIWCGGQYPANIEWDVMSRDTLRGLMDAVQGIEFRILNFEHSNLVQRLRQGLVM